MKYPVYLDFLQANQIVAALQARAVRLSTTASPDDRVTSRAVADCIAAEYTIRAAFDFERDEQQPCCGAGGSTPHWVGCPEHPKALANMAPGEVVEMYGR